MVITIILFWLLTSPAIAWIAGRFIRAGMTELQPGGGSALTERRDISSRPENWSWWVRAEAGKEPPTSERRTMDPHDARLLGACMLRLRTFDRLLLWWCYVR